MMSKPKVINMLLNPERFNGYHQGRITPILTTLAFIILPIFFFIKFILEAVYRYGLKNTLSIAVPFYIFYIWRVVARNLLEESKRVKLYRKKLQAKYDKPKDLNRIKRVHPDGCIEYFNGDIFYILVCENGNKMDNIVKAIDIDKFLTLFSDYSVNIHVYNIIEKGTLDAKYAGIKQFKDKESSKVFLDIIDHNSKYTDDRSLNTVTLFCIGGRLSDKYAIKELLPSGISLLKRYAFKSVDRANSEVWIGLDLGVFVSVDELVFSRFASGQYFDSKVLSYDKDIVQAQEVQYVERKEFTQKWK